MTAEQRMLRALYLIVVGIVVLLVLAMLLAARAFGFEGHTHEGAVGRFYQSWMQPDNPKTSCCNDQDCSPAASRIVNGKWQAEFEGEWVDIPPYKIEQERDSPDGRSHICGRKNWSGVSVFCFIRGGGT